MAPRLCGRYSAHAINLKIAEWRTACDLIGWRKLGRALNEEWGIGLGTEEWRNLLEPADVRTLRTLCKAIARHALIESLPERGFMGCNSPEGRAMRALRAVLFHLGESRQEIRTDIPVTPLLTRYGWKLLFPCVHLVPGALPAITHTGRTHRALLLLILLFWVHGLGLALFKSPLGEWSFCLGLLCMLLLGVPHRLFRGSLTLPGITTVGDLAVCIAKQQRGQQRSNSKNESTKTS